MGPIHCTGYSKRATNMKYISVKKLIKSLKIMFATQTSQKLVKVPNNRFRLSLSHTPFKTPVRNISLVNTISQKTRFSGKLVLGFGGALTNTPYLQNKLLPFCGIWQFLRHELQAQFAPRAWKTVAPNKTPIQLLRLQQRNNFIVCLG